MSTELSAIMYGLDALDDDGLRAVIDRARSLLAARSNERRKKATLEIRRLAKEHGLDVAVTLPGRKRGRPRKSEAAAT